MSDLPLVSVVVPTFNSDKHLKMCLDSISKQTYSKIEILTVDSQSTDRTVEIAQNYGKVINYSGALLGARYIGLQRCKGDLVFLLDSDQVLEKTAVKRAVKAMDKYDMLCVEERSFEPRTFTEKLFEADRKLIHKRSDLHLDPLNGVMLARVYKRQVLEKAFENIPKKIFRDIVAHDHAIIYFEAYRVSSKVGILPNGVWHFEPDSLVQLCKKNFRYGVTTKYLLVSGCYSDLLVKKSVFRKGAFSPSNLKIGLESCLLLALKAAAYEIGVLAA